MTRTIHADLALKLEVAFVCDDDDGERILVLHAQDLLVERADFLERVPRGDRVDEQKPFTGPHVLLAHGTANVRKIRGETAACLVDDTGQNDDDTDPYSSWPAVSRTSRRATSSSMTHCFLYESVLSCARP